MEAAVWKLASRKWACIIAFALIPLGLRLALLRWIPAPQPGVEDEFSYLLASDTFASGRLTNPAHPLWVFFESIHILQQPHYMSKYPPLTGLILALGQKVFGHPWSGILLSMALLCGAVAWALWNWMPPFWAFLGTALAVLKIGILSYWSESYWGGTGAAIGGALLIGSLPALIRRPTCLRGLPAAIGIALLANSRPFEGFLLTLLCMGYAAWQIIQRATAPSVWLRNLSRGIAAPLIIVMIPVGSWMAYYNFRATGSPVRMPWAVYEQQYAVSPTLLWWTSPRTSVVYRHEAFRKLFLDWELKRKIVQREHFLLTRLLFFGNIEKFYLGILLLIVIFALTPASCEEPPRASCLLARCCISGSLGHGTGTRSALCSTGDCVVLHCCRGRPAFAAALANRPAMGGAGRLRSRLDWHYRPAIASPVSARASFFVRQARFSGGTRPNSGVPERHARQAVGIRALRAESRCQPRVGLQSRRY